VDPDEAPELTEEALDELFKNGVWRVEGRIVSKEEGIAAMRQALAKDPSSRPQDFAKPTNFSKKYRL
jgi:hypothetical protein